MEDLIKLAIISIIIPIANIYIYIYRAQENQNNTSLYIYRRTGCTNRQNCFDLFFFFKGMQKGKPQTKHSEDKLIS